jgi:CHASE2 domain-containing sensor protein
MGSSPGEPAQPARPSPYLGLSPYGERDADLFFGRRRERELVVADLLTSRLTVLYGPSGVGKSSLLRAGVLPRLRRGDGLPSGGSRRIVALVDDWHGDPAQAVLRAVAMAAGATGDLPEELPFDDALAQLVERADGILLLVLDQFEEYFLYHDGDGLADGLPRFLARPDVRGRVLISLREDAVAELDRLGGASLFGNLLRLGPLSEPAAREAIERPLDGGAATLEPGLADAVIRLLGDREPRVGGARGLPAHVDGVEPAYLQLVMRRLWDRETAAGSSVLRIRTLGELGSLREIVGDHLREAMDRLAPAERSAMAKAFRYLVTPSGAKIAQSRSDLARLTGEDEPALAAPLENLAGADMRILRTVDERPAYEIFHDVLARPLLDWQERFRAARLRHRATALGMLAGATAAIVVTLALAFIGPAWLDKAELATVDARFALRGDASPPADVVIVDLDNAGLGGTPAAGGGSAPRESEGRISRDAHAAMIDVLREAGAAVIAYDFEFLEPQPGDAELRAAIERAGPQLLLAATRIDSDGQGQVLGRSGDRLSATVGYAGFPIAADGAYRQVDESVGLSGGERAEAVTSRLESFAVAAARLAGEPPERFERAWIDYRGPAGTYRTLRFANVLKMPDPAEPEAPDPAEIEGKVVVVGSSARAQGDLHPTAAGGDRVLSGAEIQANAITTLRDGMSLRATAAGVEVALIVLLGLLPALLALATRARLAALLAAVAAIAFLAFAQFLFAAGWIVPVVLPMLALLLAAAGVAVLRQATVSRLR